MTLDSPNFYHHIQSYKNEDFVGSCLDLIKKYPLFSIAGAAGKFTPNYGVWCFHIESQLPFIQKIRSICLENSEKLEKELGFSVRTDLVRISYSHNKAKEMSLWHRDGLYWNGQLHITVLGSASIAITNVREHEPFSIDNLKVICRETGDFWYLNSTEYLHKILPEKNIGPRIEITIPVNIPDKFLKYYDDHYEDYQDGCYVFTKDINDLIEYNRKSRLVKVWSSEATPQSEKPYYTNDFLDYRKLYYFNDFLKIYKEIEPELSPKKTD